MADLAKMAKQLVFFLLVLAVGSLAAPAEDLQVPAVPQSAQVSGEVNVKPAQLSVPVTQVKLQDSEEQQDAQKTIDPVILETLPSQPKAPEQPEVIGGNAPGDLLSEAAPPSEASSDLEPAESWWGRRHYGGWGGGWGRGWGGGWGGGYYRPRWGGYGWGRGYYGGWY